MRKKLDYCGLAEIRLLMARKPRVEEDEEFQTAKRGWATVRAGARRPKAPSKEPHLWVVGEGEVRPWA